MRKNVSGFTIVELLIVVVIIAILAAITIVAYNGIQARANKTAIASYASSSLRALQAYKAGEGSYPTETGCIGTGYIDRTGNGTLDCRWTPTGDTWVVSNTLNNALAKYSSIKDVKAPSIVADSGSQLSAGGYYTYISSGVTLDGNAHSAWFVYAVPDKVCPVGPFAKMVSWPALVTDNSATFSENWGTGALCWIPLK